jgi:hypothetical protein
MAIRWLSVVRCGARLPETVGVFLLLLAPRSFNGRHVADFQSLPSFM